jgi:hypothetical protein
MPPAKRLQLPACDEQQNYPQYSFRGFTTSAFPKALPWRATVGDDDGLSRLSSTRADDSGPEANTDVTCHQITAVRLIQGALCIRNYLGMPAMRSP